MVLLQFFVFSTNSGMNRAAVKSFVLLPPKLFNISGIYFCESVDHVTINGALQGAHKAWWLTFKKWWPIDGETAALVETRWDYDPEYKSRIFYPKTDTDAFV